MLLKTFPRKSPPNSNHDPLCGGELVAGLYRFAQDGVVKTAKVVVVLPHSQEGLAGGGEGPVLAGAVAAEVGRKLGYAVTLGKTASYPVLGLLLFLQRKTPHHYV